MATKNTTKRFTNPLDVGAMYQIGAGRTASKKPSGPEIPGFVKTLGNVVINYYSKIKRNQAAVRKQDNKVFASLDNAMKEAGIVDGTVMAIKEKLIGANKILNSVRGSLFPNEQRYKDAQTAANEAEYAMANLAKQYKAIPEWEEALTTLFNNELSENGETVSWENSSTVLEQYNTSLLASGQLKDAIVADGNGDLRVVTWGGKASKTGFDNPETAKIETAEDYQKMLADGTLTTIKLSEMEFIKPAGTKQKNLGNDHLGDLTDQGTRGITLTDQELAVFGDDFGTALETMDDRNFMSYVFDGKKFKFREDDGTSISIVDKLINNSVNRIGVDANGNIIEDRAETTHDESQFSEFDTSGDGKIDGDERAGAKEIIKHRILDKSYNKRDVIDLFHNKAKQAYHDKKTIYDDEESALKNSAAPTEADVNWGKIRGAASGKLNTFSFRTKEGIVNFTRIEGTDTFQGKLKGDALYGTYSLDDLTTEFAPHKSDARYLDQSKTVSTTEIDSAEKERKRLEALGNAPYTNITDVETIALTAEDPKDDEYLINVFKAKYPDFVFTNPSNWENSIKIKHKKGKNSSIISVDDNMYDNLTTFMNDQMFVQKQTKLPK